MVLLTEPVSPVVTIVPSTFGNVKVRVVLAAIDAVENFARFDASDAFITNEVVSDKDLLVSVSVPASVPNVPVVGSVTAVTPVTVIVVANAPEVVRFPPIVIVLPVLATPVPPY
jgi:hypothetical protein